ncbi:MAG: hypothetical protein JW820_06835 [Spirochaetales bacterium]|nr:hypothetical protein [Spirochaetales bacterium]
MNPKENLYAAIFHQGPEWVPCPMVDGSWRVVLHDLLERPEQQAGYDDWGVHWDLKIESEGGSYPDEHPISDPEQIKDLVLPDVERRDLLDPAIRGLQAIDRSQALVFADNGWGLFERAWLLAGMENLMVWMLEEPEAVDMLMDRILQVKLRVTERFIEEIEVDGIMYGDDWGGETSVMMGPELWRRFVKPRQKKLYDACKSRKVIVRQHSDGHTEELFEDLAEIGLDVLNPLQPECNDVEKARQMVGKRLAFHGAVGSRLLDKGRPAEIRENVKLRIQQLATREGGYIVAPAHAFAYPRENVRAFREAAIEYGRIPKQWCREFDVEKTDVEV